MVTDVASKHSVDALADASLRALRALDLVFNNAGVAMTGPTANATHDDWTWLMDVNLWGPIHGVEAFLPRMVESGAAATCCSPRPLPAWCRTSAWVLTG